MKFVIFVIFFAFIVFKQAECSVLGIDLGSEYYKISMIAPGKSFLIMENTFSKRKTHTSVNSINFKHLYY